MSATSHSLDRHEETRKRFDEEIVQLEERLISLKSARNSLAPIARLHPEILQEIFFLTHYSSPSKGKASLLLTWISHAWRELATNTTTLWSHVDFKHAEWIQLALSRTKSQELEFNLMNPSRKTPAALLPLMALALQNLPRIRILRIISRYGRTETALPKETPLWLDPAPCMIQLDLHGLTLPPNLFSGTVSRLQSLDLQNCNVDWETLPIPPGLKSFRLAQPVQQPGIHLVRILRTVASNLEHLQLLDVFVHNSLPSTISVDRIRFDKLKSIQLRQEIPLEIEAVFNMLALPYHTSIDICFSEMLDPLLVRPLVASRGIQQWPLDNLEIKIEDEDVALYITEDWSKTDRELIHEHTGAQNQIQIYISNLIDPSAFIPAFTILPIHPIKRITFTTDFYASEDLTIFNHIGTLGTVEELCIKLSFLSTFFVSIRDQIDKLVNISDANSSFLGESSLLAAVTNSASSLEAEKKARAQSIILFHNLQQLEIRGDDSGRLALTAEDASNLQKWLEWRNRADLRVERLYISRLKAPPVGWLTSTLQGLVDDFQTRDMRELGEGPQVDATLPHVRRPQLFRSRR